MNHIQIFNGFTAVIFTTPASTLQILFLSRSPSQGFKLISIVIKRLTHAFLTSLEHAFDIECHELIKEQIDMNLKQIDEARVDHAHGVDISNHVRKLKKEFNFVTFAYRDLFKEFNDPSHQSIFST